MNDAASTPEQILDMLGIADLAPEEQEAALLDIEELIYKGTMVRLVERMDDQVRDKFEKLLESDADEEAVEAFLTEHVPDADQAVAEAVAELQNVILEDTGTNQESL
jgi:hypothetical protein